MFLFLRNALLVLTLTTPSAINAQDCADYKADYAEGEYGQSLFLFEGDTRWDVTAIAQYNTIVGDHDFYNSKGVELTNVLAVLQQDRANVNRFGKPDRTNLAFDDDAPNFFYDEQDDFFTTPARRAMFADMTLVVECFYFPDHVQDFTNRFMNRETFFLMVTIFEHPNGGLGIFVGEAG